MKLALVGGTADSVVLENSKARKMEYSGMVAVKAKRRAIILVASGIDTFSKINYETSGKSSRKPAYRSTLSAPAIFSVRYTATVWTPRGRCPERPIGWIF